MNIDKVLDTNRLLAARMFSPRTLVQALERCDEGVVCVNKAKLTHTRRTKYLYVVAMSYVYGWDYSGRASTIYLEAVPEMILGGIYDPQSKKKTPPRVIAAIRGSHEQCPYIYTAEEMERLQNVIKNT